jgi:hypothetical protein
VREAAEDLFSADPGLGEVDLGWPGASLSRRELTQGPVRPGGVVVTQVLGQHLAQVVLIDDQQLVEDLAAQGADEPLADGIALGACGGLATIPTPSAANTASNDAVNWPARSLIRNLRQVARRPRSSEPRP